MKTSVFILVLVAIMTMAGGSQAAIFNASNETELRAALTTAAANNEDDIINIAAGTYNTSGSSFAYNPAATENRLLTIRGGGAGNTILDGGTTEQVMNLATTGLADDTAAGITVTGITFQNGNSTADGVGLYIRTRQADIAVQRCEFIGNIGISGQYGGGLYAVSAEAFVPTGDVTISNNSFSGNSSDNRGGGAYAISSNGTVTYDNNIFRLNFADFSGGGAYGDSSNGAVLFTNNLFQQNTSGSRSGGAMSYTSDGVVFFTHNTFSGNSTGGLGGGGIHISLYRETAVANIYNNIVWGNTSSGAGQDIHIDDDGNGNGGNTEVNLYNNCYQDFHIEVGGGLFSQADNISTDPLFADPIGGDYHVRTDSPCKDAATDSAPFFPVLDPEGIPRTRDAAPDMGVFEVPFVDLPKTGQTTSYFTGDDGDIEAGAGWPSPRFTDNGNGTITDNLTGLMWTQDANLDGAKSWVAALSFVNALNLDGYGDWRLANVNELESLINTQEASPAAWLATQGFTNVQAAYYWSATTSIEDTSDAFSFFMNSGSSVDIAKSSLYFLWPVRGATTHPAQLWKTGQTVSYAAGDDGDLETGVTRPTARFLDNGDGTVTDNLTGLMWSRNANLDSIKPWTDALSYIDTLNLAGHEDWRLPNRKEFISLMDYSESNPALPAGHPFLDVQTGTSYWTSTTTALNTDFAWLIRLGAGSLGYTNKTSSYYVWAVRGKLGPPNQGGSPTPPGGGGGGSGGCFITTLDH
ncbi:MAG: DUF1566 domain-containing protein [Thermodesulfobacteriota bacterium]|nr:DUF1566 domain-containing protein [Thermodesulfobacteriota bacterium]